MATKLKSKVLSIIEILEAINPNPQTELNFKSPFQLLVSVVLSAQCTDVRVNKTTPDLFLKFPDAKTMAKASENEIFEIIKSCSYPNNKAKHLLGLSNMLINQFGGIVPQSSEDLQKLPGVGRKTANVILSVLYDMPALAVDTHVQRVSARVGLTVNAKNPEQTEKQLMKIVPSDIIPKFHHWIILHGRYVCIARKPKCLECQISNFCDFFRKNN